MRLDKKEILGVVKDSYKVIQNADLFSVLDPLVDRKDAVYHTAGVIKNGKRVWILAKLPDDIVLKRGSKEDRIEQYLLMTNGHDGRSAGKVLMTPVRVVCDNTLSWALRGTADQVSIYHTTNFQDKLNEATRVLGLAKKYFSESKAVFQQLTKVKFSDRQVSEFLYHNGKGSDIFAGTAYNYYQAVTEFVSHSYATKADKVDSMMFGAGATLRQNAFDQLIKVIQ